MQHEPGHTQAYHISRPAGTARAGCPEGAACLRLRGDGVGERLRQVGVHLAPRSSRRRQRRPQRAHSNRWRHRMGLWACTVQAQMVGLTLSGCAAQSSAAAFGLAAHLQRLHRASGRNQANVTCLETGA